VADCILTLSAVNTFWSGLTIGEATAVVVPKRSAKVVLGARGLDRLRQEKGGQSSLFEQERQPRLRIPVDCRIRPELRMNVPLQRHRLFQKIPTRITAGPTGL
jgi:hypothetical protein